MPTAVKPSADSTAVLPDIDLDKLKDVNVHSIVQDFTSMDGTLMQLAIQWGMRVIVAIVILVIGWMVGNWINHRFENMKRLDNTLKNFIGGFFKYMIISVAVITVIGLFGIPMASLLAVMGAAGLAIGLALQGTLANVASGVMLLILRPFNVGDYITWGDEGGTVKALGLFGTELAMADNVFLFAPNSKIWGTEIINYSRNMLRRQDILTRIGYKDDINKAIGIINKVLDADARVLKEPDDKRAQVVVDKMDDFAINMIVRFWSNNSDYWGLHFDLTKAIKEALDEAGMSIVLTPRQAAVTPS